VVVEKTVGVTERFFDNHYKADLHPSLKLVGIKNIIGHLSDFFLDSR